MSDELITEIRTLQSELGSVITEVRNFINDIRHGAYSDLDQFDLADILQLIVEGDIGD